MSCSLLQLRSNFPTQQAMAFKKWKTFSVFRSSHRNTSEGLGEREMLWEHEASVSKAFSNSPKPTISIPT